MSGWPSAVIFDFDGVIVNSEPLHCRAFQEVLRAEGIELSERDYYADLIGFDDRGAFRYLFQKHRGNIDASVVERLISNKTRRMQEMIRGGEAKPLPGVAEFVRRLRETPLAICSGALRAEIEMMLDGIGLRENFPIIVAAEDVAIGKPDPSGYLLALRHISERIGRSLESRDALVVEDAPTVIESARAAGFKVVGVTTTYPADRLTHAHWVVESLRPTDVLAKIPELRLR